MVIQARQIQFPWRLWLALLLLPCLQIEADTQRIVHWSGMGVSLHSSANAPQIVSLQWVLQAYQHNLAEPQLGNLPPYALLTAGWPDFLKRQAVPSAEFAHGAWQPSWHSGFNPRAPPANHSLS